MSLLRDEMFSFPPIQEMLYSLPLPSQEAIQKERKSNLQQTQWATILSHWAVLLLNSYLNYEYVGNRTAGQVKHGYKDLFSYALLGFQDKTVVR